jgi:hypothetical protein
MEFLHSAADALWGESPQRCIVRAVTEVLRDGRSSGPPCADVRITLSAAAHGAVDVQGSDVKQRGAICRATSQLRDARFEVQVVDDDALYYDLVHVRFRAPPPAGVTASLTLQWRGLLPWPWRAACT